MVGPTHAITHQFEETAIDHTTFAGVGLAVTQLQRAVVIWIFIAVDPQIIFAITVGTSAGCAF